MSRTSADRHQGGPISDRATFLADAHRFAWPLRLWYYLLSVVNLGIPLFFLGYPEGKATVAAYFASAVLMVPMHRKLGWVRLLGVGHAPWLVLLPWLATRLGEAEPAGALRLFVLTVLVVDGVCLLVDVVDVGRYLAGDRAPLVGPGAEGD